MGDEEVYFIHKEFEEGEDGWSLEHLYVYLDRPTPIWQLIVAMFEKPRYDLETLRPQALECLFLVGGLGWFPTVGPRVPTT